MRDNIILTLFDRQPVQLMNTLLWLTRNDLTDTQLVIVNDGSTQDLSWVKTYLGDVPYVWHDMEPYEAYRIGQHNNPAKANNEALKLCTGERVFWLSSDCILPPHALERARKIVDSGAIYVPRVQDIAGYEKLMYEFNGPTRFHPMMWFVGCRLEDCLAIGGFDEEFIKGMAYEDNDFMGRLALQVGKLVFDFDTTVIHQSHPIVYLSDEDQLGTKTSREYCKRKWRGIPFASERATMNIKRKIHDSGHAMWVCTPLDAADGGQPIPLGSLIGAGVS